MRKKVKKAKNGTLQNKKKNSSSRESTKFLTRPGSTNNPRNVKALKSPFKKTGVKNPSVKVKGKVNTTKKNTKTRNELIVGALKKAPLGSNKRRKLYDIIDYKQDNTTTGYKKAKSSIKKAGMTNTSPKLTTSGKVKRVAKKAKVAKKISKVAKKVSANRAKGKAALASGNKAKALRMKKRETRKTKRVAKRAVRKSKRK